MPQSPILQDYLALSTSSPRSLLLPVLQNIVQAPIDAFSADDRVLFVQTLIDDLKDPKGRLSPRDHALALTALKTLGRNPTASRVIVKQENLQSIFIFAADAREHNLEAAQEAIRCVANALLLIDSGRDTLLDIGGGETSVEMLERANNPLGIFLASRLLFLLTVKRSPFIQKLVEHLRIIDILPPKLDFLMVSLLSGQPLAKEALTDILKFGFNLVREYPRIVHPEGNKDEIWSEKLDNLLPPLLRLFNGLPPTFPNPLAPPLTHVIHNLIMIPIIPPLTSRWFASASSPTSHPRSSPPERLQKAFSALTSGRRSISSSRSPSPSANASLTPHQQQHDTVQRAWDLLEITTAHYVPEDPDDASVRQLCRDEGVVLDDLLAPLAILLSRFAAADAIARQRMKDWILPADLDRSSPLEKREDILGRCLRLMSCVYFPQSKDTVGELLFNICDSDPGTLASQVGYGNCAGLLFNKGIMAPPSSITDAEGEEINPITGIRHAGPVPIEEEMTEEEKEIEAEKLFVLFDRLERRGMAVNPVRKAMQEGKLEGVS